MIILGSSTLRDAPWVIVDRIYQPLNVPYPWLADIKAPEELVIGITNAADTYRISILSNGSLFEYL